MRASLWLCCLLAVGLPLYADEAPNEKSTSGAPPASAQVTVTAKPVVEEIRREPLAGAVTTIGEQQIEDLNANDPAAALRRVPGLVVSRYNIVGSYGGGDGGAVFARGQGTGRPGAELSFAVDGVQKFVGVWTHPLLDNISLDAVHEIDVYKGAQPVLFGNMAFATIDVVSKKHLQEGFSGKASASYGSFATSALTAEAGGRMGNLDLLVTGGQRQSDGHREGSDGRTRSLFARAGYELGADWTLALTGDFTSGRASDPGVEGLPRPPVTPRFDTQDSMGVLTLTRRHGSTEGFVKLFVDDGSIDWLQWDAVSKSSFRSLTDWTNWGAKIRDAFEVGTRGELTAGLDFDQWGGSAREERTSGTVPQGDFRFQSLSPYVGYSQKFGTDPVITPALGIRLTESREFGTVWGGQASVTVTARSFEAHVRYARAFNLPGVWAAAFYQSYGRGDQWRSLRPELMDHWELGLTPRLGKNLRIDVTFFRDDVKEALRFVPPPPPPPQWANTGSYRAQGFEASLSADLSDRIGLYAGAAYTSTTPGDIPFTPKWTFSGGLVGTFARLRIAIDAQWVDDRVAGNLRFPGVPGKVDSYFLLNAKLTAKLPELLTGLELFVAGENLTNGEYEYRPGYPMPKITVSSGATVRF